MSCIITTDCNITEDSPEVLCPSRPYKNLGANPDNFKEHYQGFKQASIGSEGRLPLVSGLNVNVVEIPIDIQLGEVSGLAELGHEFGDQWERVLVLDCHRVECSIVLNQPE